MEQNNFNNLFYGLGFTALSLIIIGYSTEVNVLARIGVVLATTLALVLISRQMNIEKERRAKSLKGKGKPYVGFWDIRVVGRYIWACVIVFAFGCGVFQDLIWAVPSLASFILLIYLFVKVKVGDISEPDIDQKYGYEHGSAEIVAADVLHANNPMPETGLYIGGGYLRSKSGHLLTCAGAGQGKTTCLVIPTLLVNPFCSYVVTDPKGEIAFITASFQKRAGQNVYIIDPWNEQEKLDAIHDIKPSGFNPFVLLRSDRHELRDNCEAIAMYLIPDKPEEKDPYWNDRARALIKVLLMHIVTALPEEEHNFWTLYKMLRLPEKEWASLLFDLKINPHEDGLIAIAAGELIGLEANEKTMSIVKSAAHNATTIFESPQLRKSLESDDFDPYSLTNGKTTVYVVLPERYFDTHSTWLRMIVGLTLKACNNKPKKRVTFMLDEFAVMGQMKDIKRGYAYARGQNIVLWAFVQSLSQLKQLYQEEGLDTFIGNTAVFEAFGVKDNYSKQYISDQLGESTAQKASHSFSTSRDAQGDITNSPSTSYETYQRPVLTTHEVETIDAIIAIIEGARTLLPKVPYFRKGLLYPFENDPTVSHLVEEKKITGEKLDWADVFKDRADPPPRLLD